MFPTPLLTTESTTVARGSCNVEAKGDDDTLRGEVQVF
jgi:hypothetical protein